MLRRELGLLSLKKKVWFPNDLEIFVNQGTVKYTPILWEPGWGQGTERGGKEGT